MCHGRIGSTTNGGQSRSNLAIRQRRRCVGVFAVLWLLMLLLLLSDDRIRKFASAIVWVPFARSVRIEAQKFVGIEKGRPSAILSLQLSCTRQQQDPLTPQVTFEFFSIVGIPMCKRSFPCFTSIVHVFVITPQGNVQTNVPVGIKNRSRICHTEGIQTDNKSS